MRKLALLLIVVLASCSGTEQRSPDAAIQYFDVRGYFNKEAKRLSEKNPTINKTVLVNGTTENKPIKITDWHKELASFIDADINKRAWEGEFLAEKTGNGMVYTSNNEKVPVKKLEIIKDKERITGVFIIIKNSNYLYTSSDTLSYFPDSLYQIRKAQHVTLMSPKTYRITGVF
jgi:hypothetical protein